MAFYEERAKRNGVSLPIQCLTMQQCAPAKPPRMHYHDYTELLYGTGGRVTVHVGEKRFSLGEGDLATRLYQTTSIQRSNFCPACCWRTSRPTENTATRFP